MNRTINLHLHIEHLQLNGVDLAYRHELGLQISKQLTKQLKALLQQGPSGHTVFDKDQRITLGSVSTEPLVYQGSLRPGPLGSHIAKHVANAIMPTSRPSHHQDNTKTASGKGNI